MTKRSRFRVLSSHGLWIEVRAARWSVDADGGLGFHDTDDEAAYVALFPYGHWHAVQSARSVGHS